VRRLFLHSSPARARAAWRTRVALGDVRGPAGGLGVGRGGGREVAAQLVQVAADGVPAVPLADNVAQPVVSRSPAAGAEDAADRDRADPAISRLALERVLTLEQGLPGVTSNAPF
jgi:hypothetical protein